MITKEQTEQVGVGTVVLSVDSTPRSPSVVVRNNGVCIVGNNPSMGIFVDDGGITVQGKIMYTSSGRNLTKGNYSENDNGAKPYTYQETVRMESAALEQVYEQMGKNGIDTSSISKMIDSGKVPIMTDISAGPLPHMHTINSFKHVHKIEPAYLYRVSPVLGSMKDTMSSFKTFLGK